MASTIVADPNWSSPLDMAVYTSQIFNTLHTLTVKYPPMVDAMTDVAAGKGVMENTSDPTQRKYYLNLIGEYSPSDTVMTIISLDTQQEMDYTKANLLASPQTMQLYVPGSTYWEDLCNRYPDQVALIKNIRYPVADIQTAIDAEPFTRLQIDTSFLEEAERDWIVDAIDQMLDFIYKRWYAPIFNYEPYFPWAFEGMMYQGLANACFTARIRAIRKAEAHSFHIWEYLTSHALDNYSDILTSTQAQWLYRNLEYIIANRGKQTNLVILAENLLSGYDLTLHGREVINEAVTKASSYELTPLFRAHTVPTSNATDAVIPTETFSAINTKLIAAMKEHQDAPEYISEQEDLLSTVGHSTYPTKILEIALVERNRQYAETFDTYIWEMAIYTISQNLYNSQVKVRSTDGKYDILLDPNDAILLLFYILRLSMGVNPDSEIIPTEYPFQLATPPGKPTIPRYAYARGQKIIIPGLVDVSSYTQDLDMVYKINQPTDLSALVLEGFTSLASQMTGMRATCDTMTLAAMSAITKLYHFNEKMPLNLSSSTTYGEWKTGLEPILSSLFISLASADDPMQAYSDFSVTLLRAIVPVIDGFSKYGEFSITQGVYTRLLQLFVQLTSYNVAFVQDDISTSHYLLTPHITNAIDTTISEPHFPLEVDVYSRKTTTTYSDTEKAKVNVCTDMSDEYEFHMGYNPVATPTLVSRETQEHVFTDNLTPAGVWHDPVLAIKVPSGPIGATGKFTIVSVPTS